MSKEELEHVKLKLEIENLQSDLLNKKSGMIKSWVLAVSVSASVIASAFAAWHAFNDISLRNQEVARESTMRSSQIFLNSILDKLSGTIVHRHIYDTSCLTNGEDCTDRSALQYRDSYPGTTQEAAYEMTISLSCEFKNLAPSAIAAFEDQLNGLSPDANDSKKRLQSVIAQVRNCTKGE